MSFAHSHDGTGVHEPPGHGQTPHFHWHFFETPPHHRHGDEAHAHDADDDHHDNDAPDLEAPATDHDDDAVYLAGPVTLGWSSQHSQVASGSFSTFVAMAGMGSFPLAAAALSVPLAHPPPLLLYQHCPIYLLTLALLI